MTQKVYHLLILVLVCLICQSANAQQSGESKPTSVIAAHVVKNITVSVKDLQTSKPIDSARVVLSGKVGYTRNGLVTIDGVAENALISVTKAGYYMQSKKISANAMEIFLVKSIEDEPDASTVNNGLYLIPVSSFSGSATTINGNDLRRVNPNNFVEAVRFFVPSLNVIVNNNNGNNPNALPQINLRGSNSFPYAATVANNNNAANGVQASPSSADFVAASTTAAGTPVILLDGIQVSLQTAADIDMTRIQSVTVLKDASATAVYGMRGGAGVIAIQTVRPKGIVNVSLTSQVQIATADISSYHLLNAQQKLAVEAKAGLINSTNSGANTNWLSMPLNTGVGTKNSLALSGGDNDVTYGLNASYNDIEGSMKGSNRKIADLGAYFGGHFGSFSFSNSFSFMGTNSANSPYGALNNYAGLNPYWNPYDPGTGKMVKILATSITGSTTVNYFNPAYNATIATTDVAKYSRFANTTNLNWVIARGLQLDGVIGFSKQSDQSDYFLPPDNTAFGNVNLNDVFTRGSYNYTTSSFTNAEGKLSLQYQRSFGKGKLLATVGENIIQTNSEAAGILVTGFTVDRMADIAFGANYGNSKPSGNQITTRYLSSFGSLAYSYDERYQVDLSGAQDYYSNTGANPTRYAAAGLSWNAANEAFLKSCNWVNGLKIRTSVGTTGNQSFLAYQNQTTYNYLTDQQYVAAGSSIATIGQGLGAYLTGFANPNLKAPQTLKMNAGLDAALFGSRLLVDFDIYQQKTTNLLLPDVSTPSTGFLNYAYYQNYGGIENKGFEFSLIANLFKAEKNNFSIDLTFNGIHNKSIITSVSPFINNLNVANNTTANQTAVQPQYIVGNSPTAIWAVPSLGIDPANGKEIFQSKAGATTENWNANDKVVAGDMTPSLTGSFGTDVTYKQFAFGMYFRYQLGAKVYNQTLADMENADLTYNVDSRAASAQRWTAGMTNALYKGISANGLLSNPTYATTRFVQNDNKIQAGSLMLSYQLPVAVAHRMGAKGLTLRLLANNAFQLGGADMQRGIYYPFQRNYTTSLNVNF